MSSIYLAENIGELVRSQKSTTSAYILNYHIAFRTKRNMKLFTGGKSRAVLDVIMETAERKGYAVLAAAVLPDHVHLVLGLRPVDRISDVLQALKGITSKTVRNRFTEIRNMDKSLWSDGYYVESVGLKNVKQVISYIHRQEDHHSEEADPLSV
jgi:putative transposase